MLTALTLLKKVEFNFKTLLNNTPNSKISIDDAQEQA